jgi:predicted house-cleaning noncanonical NTP pyrophosphatase (MazG superfamily)
MKAEYIQFFDDYFTNVRSRQLKSDNIKNYQDLQEELVEKLEEQLSEVGKNQLNELEEMFNMEMVEKIELAYRFGLQDSKTFLKLHLGL